MSDCAGSVCECLYECVCGTVLLLERPFIESVLFGLILTKGLSQCACADISLSRLATVALAA